MQITSATFFAGPNRHVLRPAMEVMLDLQEHSDASTAAHPRFVEGLLLACPGLSEHYCARGHKGGFVERLHEGTYLGHVVEHVTLECLYLGGERGVYGKTRSAQPRHVMIVFESETEQGALRALSLSIKTVLELWEDPDYPVSDGRFEKFKIELSQYRLGPSTRAIVEAARRRDIPVARLDHANFIRLGQGVQQHRIRAAMTDRTSIVSVEAAQDKNLTAHLVAEAGLPVPRRRVVASFFEAASALDDLGTPVVIKPIDGSHGRGVVMDVISKRDLRRAVESVQMLAADHFIVEQQIAGRAIRLLVVGDQMVAATERMVPEIIGDGQHTVDELVAITNRDPLRGPGHGFPMSWVARDVEATHTLSAQGLDWSSILAPGQLVQVRRTANMSTGAIAKDITAEVSVGLARDAVRAARAVGLDIAGVDVVTPHLDQPLSDASGAVIEVNASPGLRMHLFPSLGMRREVADHLLDYLFGEGTGRIPIAAITGTNGKTTVTRMLAHIGASAGFQVGMATTDGITIGGETIKRGDLTGPWSARLVLNDPTVELAVLETARGGLARGGLGFDDVDVGVITNIGQDHLGQDGVETLKDLIHLKSLVVDVIRSDGKAVLNADDENVRPLSNRCRGAVIYFSTQPGSPYIADHLASGGEAVFIKRGYLYYGCHQKEHRLIGTRALPSSLGGVAKVNVANAAAAAAAALALGFTTRQVALGLSTFPAGGAGVNRGRLEMLLGKDVRVLVDYGHNIPAITQLGEICRSLKPHQIVTVLGLPGDRRDNDIAQSARVVAGFSHRIVIREDADLRGRHPGEMAALIQHAAKEQPHCEVGVVLDESEAVRQAILEAKAGALVLILYERYTEVRHAAEMALQEREAVLTPREDLWVQA